MTVTFFGHSSTTEEIKPTLKNIVVELIEKYDADIFYVGNHGGFDNIVSRVLKECKKEYPHIKYNIVLAYLPKKKDADYEVDYSDTIYPDGLENIPQRLAIIKRNEWMLKRADIVVTRVIRIIGGAAKFKELAEKQGKNVINMV